MKNVLKLLSIIILSINAGYFIGISDSSVDVMEHENVTAENQLKDDCDVKMITSHALSTSNSVTIEENKVNPVGNLIEEITVVSESSICKAPIEAKRVQNVKANNEKNSITIRPPTQNLSSYMMAIILKPNTVKFEKPNLKLLELRDISYYLNNNIDLHRYRMILTTNESIPCFNDTIVLSLGTYIEAKARSPGMY